MPDMVGLLQQIAVFLVPEEQSEEASLTLPTSFRALPRIC